MPNPSGFQPIRETANHLVDRRDVASLNVPLNLECHADPVKPFTSDVATRAQRVHVLLKLPIATDVTYQGQLVGQAGLETADTTANVDGDPELDRGPKR